VEENNQPKERIGVTNLSNQKTLNIKHYRR